MALKHTFQSAKSDGADATQIQPSNWNAEHVPDADGILFTASTTDPATPASGFLNLYAKQIANRNVPKWVGPAGVDVPVQASLGYNRVTTMCPAGGTTATTVVSMMGPTGGFTASASTFSSVTLTNTRLTTSVRRCTLATSTTAGTVVYLRCNSLECWRGNLAGLGGFFFTVRFGTEGTIQTGMRVFAGLADSIGTPTNVNPLTSTTPGKIGMAYDQATSANWQLVTNITGTAPTVLDLGASFPVNTSTSSLMELTLYCAPNGSTVGYRVWNLGSGVVTSGTLSTNLPANTTFLAPLLWATNNATSAAVTLGFNRWYLETDN